MKNIIKICVTLLLLIGICSCSYNSNHIAETIDYAENMHTEKNIYESYVFLAPAVEFVFHQEKNDMQIVYIWIN